MGYNLGRSLHRSDPAKLGQGLSERPPWGGLDTISFVWQQLLQKEEILRESLVSLHTYELWPRTSVSTTSSKLDYIRKYYIILEHIRLD